MTLRLLLVRHGVTLHNLERRYTGQADVELAPAGYADAETLGIRLAKASIDLIVSSDLKRSRETARLIADWHGLPVHEDPRLRELSLGSWEHAPYAEIARRFPEQLKDWQRDPLSYAPPGGETVDQVCTRVVAALAEWQGRCSQGTMLWVSHGGVLGVLLCHLLGMDLRRRSQFRFENTALTEVELGEGYPLLLRFNDALHQDGLSAQQRVSTGKDVV